MDIKLFDPPTAISGLVHAGFVSGASSVSVVERLAEPGWVEVTIPFAAPGSSSMTVGRIMGVGGSWAIIEDVRRSVSGGGDILTVAGRDLKGLVSRRVTSPAVDGGWFTADGTTEFVAKMFVRSNMGDLADDARRIPGLSVAADMGRGREGDRYRAWRSPLDTVLRELCESALIGYDIVPDFTAKGIVFDVISGVDRSAEQNERPRVLLDTDLLTAQGVDMTDLHADSVDVIYATAAGYQYADEALTLSYTRPGEEPQGIERRERHVEYSLDVLEDSEIYAELRRKAEAEAVEAAPVVGLTCSLLPSSRYEYRRDFYLGDTVTVRGAGVVMHAPLVEVSRQWSGGGYTISATFGKAAVSPIKKIRRRIL